MSEFEMMYLNYVLKDTQSQQNILFLIYILQNCWSDWKASDIFLNRYIY